MEKTPPNDAQYPQRNQVNVCSIEQPETFRGVQYVHCMMHTCIMVKVWGSEKHVKQAKLGKLNEIREENLEKQRKINFQKGGECTLFAKIGGKCKF